MNSFKVSSLPPNIDCESVNILKALTKSARSLAELKGEIKKIPNSQILIDTLSLQEARDSNEVENIVTTNDEIFKEIVEKNITSLEVKEATNYAYALKFGFNLIKERGILTINDIKQLQEIISPNHPIRKIPGTNLKNAKREIIYTPPQNYEEITNLLNNLEEYMNYPEFHEIDSLIKMPIIHYQFESIHPFYDGNGRTGRLLNILFLVQQKLLDIPVLYLSSYVIRNKAMYYKLLQDVRTENNWEEWIIWMLKGVEETSKETIKVVNNIKILMDNYKTKIRSEFSFYSHELINTLFKYPYTKIDFLSKELKVHRNTASSYLNTLTDAGLLTKIKIGKSNYYLNKPLFDILKDR